MKNLNPTHTIFITSNEPWGPLWFSKHHYANELSQMGYQVNFIDPVKPWNPSNIFSGIVFRNKINENLTVLSYHNNLPVRIFPRLCIAINDFLNCWKIKRVTQAKPTNTIWWQFDFQRFIHLPFFRKARRIYHVVDPYMHSPLDRIMAQKAHLIIGVSEEYIPYYRKNHFGKKVTFVPHCIPGSDIYIDKAKAASIKAEYGNFAFFAGTINRDVDIELLKAVVENGIPLVIAGKESDLPPREATLWSELIRNKKAKYIGVIPAMDIKEYVYTSSVCLSAYKFGLQKVIGQRTPLKIVSYLSQHKPVVISTDPGIQSFNNHTIYKANTKDEYIDLVRLGIKDKLKVDSCAIDAYISERMYDKQIERIINQLKAPEPIKVIYIISQIDKALEFEWVAEHLDREKFSLAFILLNPGDSALARFVELQGLPVYHVPYSGKKSAIRAFVKLFFLLRKLKPDIVHTHMYDATFLGQIAARLADIRKRIYTRHHSTFNHLYHPHAVKKDKLVNRLVTDIVSISGNVSKILLGREQVASTKIHLIPHCLDFNAFANISQERIVNLKNKYKLQASDSPIIGVISRYTEWKGVQYIIPAFKKLLKSYPNATLVLANAKKGEYAEEIDKLLKELSPERYREISFEQDLFALYQLFDVFVHTPIDNHSEAFGQIYIEALAAKIPSVFTLSGIASDFIQHEQNAFVVPYCNSNEILSGIGKILTDNKFRDKITDQGYKDVSSRFILKDKIKRLEELYLKE